MNALLFMGRLMLLLLLLVAILNTLIAKRLPISSKWSKTGLLTLASFSNFGVQDEGIEIGTAAQVEQDDSGTEQTAQYNPNNTDSNIVVNSRADADTIELDPLHRFGEDRDEQIGRARVALNTSHSELPQAPADSHLSSAQSASSYTNHVLDPAALKPNKLDVDGLHDYYKSYDKQVVDLLQKYRGRFVCVNSPLFPHCEFYLCGTVHVARNSSAMVKEVIKMAVPQYVVLELCEGRVNNLDDCNPNFAELNLTFSGVVAAGIHERSFKTLGIGLLTWMQLKASKVMGSKLGGELSVAAREAYIKGATVILGDRVYAVTVQRIFDALGLMERIKFLAMMLWETLTMSVFKMREYISKSENEEDFIKNEITSFSKQMPAFARVVLTERDEYLAQTLMEIAKVGFGPLPPPGVQYYRKGKILAVVGAGHLEGICRHLKSGEINATRLNEISSSSKHNSTWPGPGILQVVDMAAVYDQRISASF